MEPTDTPSRVPLLHRSALKATGPSKRLSPPPQVTSTGVHFNEAVKISEYSDSSYPTPPEPRSVIRKSKTKSPEEKTIRSTSQIPTHGPVPAFTLPSSHSRAELEALSFQLASQLRFGRIAEEDEVRRRDEPPGLDRRPPKRNVRDEFPEFKKVLMGPWVSGSDYGPVLEHSPSRAVTSISLHPALAGPFNADRFLEWDLLCDLDAVAFHTGNRKILLDTFRSQPATAPRLASLYIVSSDFSWRPSIMPLDLSCGLTIHDVLGFLASFFRSRLHDTDAELIGMTEDARARMEQAKAERLVKTIGPPFICRADRLLGKRKLAGFVYDVAYVPAGQTETDKVFIQLRLAY